MKSLVLWHMMQQSIKLVFNGWVCESHIPDEKVNPSVLLYDIE